MLSCDVIAVPGKDPSLSVAYKIASSAVPEIASKKIVCIDMPMTKDPDLLFPAHIANANIISGLLDQDLNVGFLTLGDTTIYSTYFYIADILKRKGYVTATISGVSSFLSAAALVNDKLTSNSDMLHIIPATYNISDSLQLSGTKVFMKAGNKLKEW